MSGSRGRTDKRDVAATDSLGTKGFLEEVIPAGRTFEKDKQDLVDVAILSGAPHSHGSGQATLGLWEDTLGSNGVRGNSFTHGNRSRHLPYGTLYICTLSV